VPGKPLALCAARPRNFEAANVAGHLQECAGCRQFYEGLESNHTLLRSLRREAVTPASLARMRVSLFSHLENPAAVLMEDSPGTVSLNGIPKAAYAVAGMAIAAIVSITLFAQMRHVAGRPGCLRPRFLKARHPLRPIMGIGGRGHDKPTPTPFLRKGLHQPQRLSGICPKPVSFLRDRHDPGVAKALDFIPGIVKDSRRFEADGDISSSRAIEGRETSKASALPKSDGLRCLPSGSCSAGSGLYPVLSVLRTAAGCYNSERVLVFKL